MNDRRQAFKREPIEVDLGDRVISVGPIPWEKRNDFGDAVIGQYTTIINEAVVLFMDEATGAPQLDAKLKEKYSDPTQLLRLGLEDGAFEAATSEPLYENQIIALLLAICEVNSLSQLRAILDPNWDGPTTLGGLQSVIGPLTPDSPTTESGLDSSSPGSAETPSEPSPILSS
jgi:hypothetical protein